MISEVIDCSIIFSNVYCLNYSIYMHSLGIPFLVKNMQMSYVFYPKGQTATLNKPWCILIMQEGEKMF